MTISIELKPEEERKLAELARARGKNPSELAHAVVTTYLSSVDQNGDRSFAEILAPVWEGWRQAGLTDEELDTFFQQELQATRSERRQAKGAK